MDIRQGNNWVPTKARLLALADKYGFKYLSFIGEHPLGSYGISESRFGERLLNSVTVDIEKGPDNRELTVQFAVKAICEDAGVPYQFEKSGELADPQRRNFTDPVHIKDVTLEKALLDVLSPVGLRFDLDENGLFLYKSAKQATSKTKKQKTNAKVLSEGSRGKRVELSYDDNSSDGRKSIAGSGHAVIFDVPDKGWTLRSVRIFGSRYGADAAPKEDFSVWVCDEDFTLIEEFKFPYSRFTKGEPKWVTLRLKPIIVPSTFVICAGFNPERTKGVYIHYDNSTSGNSFTGLPGKDIPVFNDGDWMIHAIVETVSPVGKWESVDFVAKPEDFKPGQKRYPDKLLLKKMVTVHSF